MYPTVYMALLSALRFRQCLTPYAAALFDGDLSRAYCAVDDAADVGGRSPANTRARNNAELTALADVSLLLDDPETAEQFYRKAQKMVWRDDRQLRVQSCRNTGWLSLMRGRLGVAQRSFARIASEGDAEADDAIEACIGMAIVHHELAEQQAADEALVKAAELADAHPEPRYRLLIDVLAQEFDVRLTVRASRTLTDHAFWQSALSSLSLGAGARAGLAAANVVTQRPALLALRIEALHCLERLARGEVAASASLLAVRARQASASPRLAFRSLVDLALAAFAGGLMDLAAELIERLPAEQTDEERRNVDYLYCMSKVARCRGNVEHALKFYSSYTVEALRCVRSESTILRPASTAHARMVAPSDDVSARLPAKYRRAYRYIIENLDREDLTTREVAAELNVTMRTIQLVFKRALGVTPCALIRSLRLEGIRAELLDENGPAPAIFDTAARWGVKNRSTLAKGYRKHFKESPTETIVAHAQQEGALAWSAKQ